MKGRALAVAGTGFLAGTLAGARLGNRAWRATLTAARYRAQQDRDLAAAEAQLDLAAKTIDGMRAELGRQRREYAALEVRTDELIAHIKAQGARSGDAAFQAGLGVGRSATVAELLGGRWTRN
jgi:hypothetical protein